MSLFRRIGTLVLALVAAATPAWATTIDLSVPGPVLPSQGIPGTLQADVDGDGLQDGLETGSSYDGWQHHLTLIVHRNLGLGTFQTTTYPTPWVEQTLNGWGPYILQAAELTGDNRPDVYIAVDELRASCVVTDLVTMINDGSGQFLSGQTWSVGPEIRDILVQDLSGDGKPDLVAIAHDWKCYDPGEEGRLLVWRNLGFGQFGNPVNYPPGSTVPRDPVAIGDLDRNGTPDIAMSGLGQYLPNVGGGSFGLPITFGPAATALWLGVLDVNGDGANDLARIHAGGIDAYLNDGTGHFSARSLSTVPLSQYLVRDLNRDGIVDFVTAGSGLVVTLVSDGTGGFAITSCTQETTQPFVPVDLDTDGRDDLILVNASESQILMQRPDGTFSQSHYGLGGEQPVQVATLDDDDLPDILLTSASATAVLFNEGGGSFTATTFAVGGSQPTLCADLNVDGLPDVVLRAASWFTPLRNRGDRTFAVLPSYVGTPLSIKDADGDTRPDILAQHPSGVLLIRGLGDGRFIAPMHVDLNGSPVEQADFDRDGHPDVLVANAGEHGFKIVPRSGPGTFGPQRVVDWSDTQAATFKEAVVADFDANGAPDLAIVRVGRLTLFLNQGPETLFGPFTNYLEQTFPTTAAAGDFDGDGDLDLVTNGWVDLTLLLRNDGQGAFTGPSYLSLGDPRAFAAADFDQDGRLDLVVRTPAEARVCWGRGDGTFDSPVQLAPVAASYADRVVTVDLDADGGPDIVLYGPSGLCVLRHRLGRMFDTAAMVNPGLTPQTVRAADLDGDRALELIAVSPGAADFAVLRQDSGSFQSILTYRAAAAHAGAVVGDWTGDGQPDLLLADALFENRTIPRTAVAIRNLQAVRSGAGVELVWAVDEHSSLETIQVLRAESAAGPFMRCGDAPLVPSSVMRFSDGTAVADHAYWYRLVGNVAGGVGRVLASIDVPALADSWHTRLIGARPVSPGAVEVRFTIGRAGTNVDVALYDVRGRRVLPALHETLGAGAYLRVLPGGSAQKALPRGVYFVRFEAGATTAAKKITILKR